MMHVLRIRGCRAKALFLTVFVSAFCFCRYLFQRINFTLNEDRSNQWRKSPAIFLDCAGKNVCVPWNLTECPRQSNFRPPWPEPGLPDRWVTLGTDDHVHAYSAWLDDRETLGNTTIRIVGLGEQGRNGSHGPSRCAVLLRNDTYSADADSSQAVIISGIPLTNSTSWDHHNCAQAFYFFFCHINMLTLKNVTPIFVSLLRDEQDCVSTSPLIRVHHYQRLKLRPKNSSVLEAGPVLPSSSREPLSTLAVCVKPLFGNLDPWIVIEFIEIYRLQGASHFYMYILGGLGHDTLPRDSLLRPILENYKEQGLLTVLPWDVPVDEMALWDDATAACLNDCAYRTMYRHKYTALVDVDEVLMPVPKLKLISLVRQLSREDRYGSFRFRNTIFYAEWNQREHEAKGHFSPFLNWTMRTARIWADKIRTKYIILPEKVDTVNNHFAERLIHPYVELAVPTRTALMFHYRTCPKQRCSRTCPTVEKNVTCPRPQQCIDPEERRIEDRTLVDRYGGRLINATVKRVFPKRGAHRR